jgi:hypothetical protein
MSLTPKFADNPDDPDDPKQCAPMTTVTIPAIGRGWVVSHKTSDLWALLTTLTTMTTNK